MTRHDDKDSKERKKEEVAIAESFLRLLCLSTDNLVPAERPDIFFRARLAGGREAKVGLELTEYHSDEKTETGSPGRRLHDAWQRLKHAIAAKTCANDKLRGITGGISLCCERLPESRAETDQLATELSSFAARVVEEGRLKEDVLAPFGEHATLMNRYLRSFWLMAGSEGQPWQCAGIDACAIGLRVEGVRELLLPKRSQANSYDWRDADERWLLVHAGSDPGKLVTLAGSLKLMEWKLSRLADLRPDASRSGFDRVYFFEWTSQWAVELWCEPRLEKLPTAKVVGSSMQVWY